MSPMLPRISGTEMAVVNAILDDGRRHRIRDNLQSLKWFAVESLDGRIITWHNGKASYQTSHRMAPRE